MFSILAHKISGIYEIRNTTNGNFYIGSSVDINKRWVSHRSDLRKGKHGNAHLQRAWIKYGEDCFQFSVIEQCDKKLVIEREQFYIDTLRPAYNMAIKAGSNLGTKYSEEARRNISKGKKEWWNLNKAFHIPWNKGKKGVQLASEETRKKMSQTRTGKTHTKEELEKMSKAQKGRFFSEETRRKMSLARKDRVVSDETRKKLSEKGKTAWGEGGKRFKTEYEKEQDDGQ